VNRLRLCTIASGFTVILGSFPEGQQPDGNSVIFTAPAGLVVMDTGRHAEHTQRILDFAQRSKQPIAAIINSHWHLDHIGGNSRIRAAYPAAQIYASGAIEGALTGFLADYRRDLEAALQRMPDNPQAAAWRGELALIAAAPDSTPDSGHRITHSGPVIIAGHQFAIHLQATAATAGDVWLLDPATHVVAAGDLVTLPAPFLDTACPQGWATALNAISHAQFETLIPGHGAQMSRNGFETYHHAFANLLTCAAATERASSDCVEGWIHDAGALIPDADQARARKMMDYYMTNALRGKPERVEKLCASR
jgi:glyoxylase-like metal-dependent hydrolase (beta-lactamase superfamily II)